MCGRELKRIEDTGRAKRDYRSAIKEIRSGEGASGSRFCYVCNLQNEWYPSNRGCLATEQAKEEKIYLEGSWVCVAGHQGVGGSGLGGTSLVMT